MLVHGQRNLEESWRVSRAEIVDNLETVWATIDIQNISGRAIRQAIFYGEYYDAQERLCYTALFDITRNQRQRTGRFERHEARTLVSIAANMGLAVEAKQVRLFVILQDPVDHLERSAEAELAVYAPVTLNAMSMKATWKWQKLCLDSETEGRAGPVLDLALAHIRVNSEGKMEEVKTLDTLNPVVESWFREFVAHLKFRPARSGRMAEASSTILLVRALGSAKGVIDSPFVPSASPWLKAYADTLAGAQVPPVNIVLLDSPPPAAASVESDSRSDNDRASRSCVQYYGTGSDWSLGILNSFRSQGTRPTVSRKGPGYE